MKTTTVLLPTLAALARASPLVARQDIDFDLVDSAPDPSTVSIPIGPTAQSVTYNLASATAAATATPLPVEAVEKRGLVAARSACDALPVGAGPTPVPDTADAFLEYYLLSNAAINAEVPTGYEQTFSNLQASSSAYGYLGYTTLSSYDTAAAATQCDSITGCLGFNIFFERDPSLETGADCPNPPSTTVIKAVFWGGYVEAANANNAGQWRNDFHVVIAGSNGYMKTAIPTVPGFNGESLGDVSISAPDNCQGENTYMGSKIFTTSIFDPNLCAAACASQNEYNTANPPADGEPMICKYFTTYLMAKNGNPEGQYCVLYTQYWDSSYATNAGQWYGDDHYTVGYAFSYVNAEDNGVPVCVY
ncbi:hypothetical protein F4775DRAFT_591339 [Biscogniauxia sp. FL1348]|nr:hypothetical protein F4775DRAFT_591339 [Biscogniauxia sp. FL1348]